MKRAAKAKLIFRGVKEVTKALRKKEKGYVLVQMLACMCRVVL